MNRIKSLVVASIVMMSTTTMHAQTLDEAIQLYKYGRFESAKKILEPLSASNPLANYYLGLSELGMENPTNAKAIFQKYPDDAANSAGVARLLFAENKTPEAMSMLSKVAGKVKKKDWTPLRYAADAITYSEGGDPNVAIDWYKKAIDMERTGDLYLGLGDAYRKIQGGGGNAMTNYEYANDFENTKSLANFKMGNLWYAARNYDSALAKYSQSSALDMKNPLPYKSLADAYYKIKKYKISKDNIEKYLELSDKSIDDQIQYANTLFLAQDYPNAITKMNDLVAKGEGDKKPYMYRILGYSQYETKDYKSALMNMDKLFAKHDPKKIITTDYSYYAKILLKDSTKKAQAITYFDKAIAADTTKDKAATYREFGDALKDAENYVGAATYYKKVLDSNSPSIESLDYWWTGAMYYYSKDYANADAMYKLMGEKYPEEPSSFYWRGNVAVASKDKEYKNGAASEFFTKYVGMVKMEDADKKKYLQKAYTYLAMVAYTAKKKEDTKLYVTKLQTLDPNDDTAKQLVKALETMK